MSLDPDMAWLLALIGLYAVFLLWYGGRTRPLSAAEVQAFLELMRRHGLDQDDPDLYAALERLLAEDDGREFLMLNLIHYRDKAAYPPGMNLGDSAIAADRRYARAFFPWLLRYGNVPVLIARRSGSFIEAANTEHWDMVALIRYRSRRDFIRTASAVAGKQIMVHKWAAIETTHVFPIRTIFSFIAVRLMAATVLAIVALIAWNL
jgi:hypothetical protein